MAIASFLQHPGVAGPFGALMDEYARAAEDFCRVVEGVSPERFTRERESGDPDTRSIRAVCLHAAGAAHRYADYIRRARGAAEEVPFVFPSERLTSPLDLRAAMREGLQYTEQALEGLYEASEEEFTALKFHVRWGPVYDPEMILEHAIVHLLRHRRQIERWP